MRLIFFFLFLVTVSGSYAYDCSVFSEIDYQNCVALNSTNESLIAGIIYTNTTTPDYNLIAQYNQNIVVTNPPNNAVLNNSEIIKNAWVEILTVDPSVRYSNVMYVPEIANYRTESGFEIQLPSNYYNNAQVNNSVCQILYSSSNTSALTWKIDDTSTGSGKNIQIISSNYTSVEVQANIQATSKADTYLWSKNCCKQYKDTCQKYCMQCQYSTTSQKTDQIIVTDKVYVTSYNHNPNASFTIIDNYAGTYKGFLYKDDETSVKLEFNNSYYKDNEFEYYAKFSQAPYNFLYLTAEKRDSKTSKNLLITSNHIYVNNESSCTIEKSDFFKKEQEQCTINITAKSQENPTNAENNSDLGLLIKIIVFIFILYLIYSLIKKYWGKKLIPVVSAVLIIPWVSAAEDCGISNLASCIPLKIYEFFLNMLNAPLEPLLNLVKNLISSSPSISIFQGLWAIIVYCLSLFYGALFVYAGFLFLFSGHDVIRREMAKEWLKNTVIMIVLIQASYYLYGLFLDLGSTMTTAILSKVDPHFFMLTADNLVNIGLEFVFVLLYALVLILTLLFLTIRYLMVASGILFLPIGIFCYFIPPLKSYGKLILNLIGMFVFITVIDAIIILACSMLISLPIFENIKILVMITCFLIINILFFMLGKHIIQKTALEGGTEKITQAAKYIATML